VSVDLSDVPERFRAAVEATLKVAGVGDGHLAVEVVDAERIRELNRSARGIDRPTDVLSFPIDGGDAAAGPRELGDVVIYPSLCEDETEAVVHGLLHLCGYDHETDNGEMLTVQSRIMDELRDG
jgi:probable rRNA maturation factor